LGWVEEALEIEVNKLAVSATPAADQPAALGHNPQQITAGRITELPVGIGSITLNQRHEKVYRAEISLNLLQRVKEGCPQSETGGTVSGMQWRLVGSVVVDAAVDVGGIEVTEHLEGRWGLGLLGVV
jgi:hypothetical protein